jgi:hypothetical protein
MERPGFNAAAETYFGRIRTSLNMRFPVIDGIIGIRGAHLVSEKQSGFRGLVSQTTVVTTRNTLQEITDFSFEITCVTHVTSGRRPRTVARSRQMYIKLVVEALAYHPFYLGSELMLVGVRKPIGRCLSRVIQLVPARLSSRYTISVD